MYLVPHYIWSHVFVKPGLRPVELALKTALHIRVVPERLADEHMYRIRVSGRLVIFKEE
jgi:hypothetical protein